MLEFCGIYFKGLKKDFILSLLENTKSFNIINTVNAEFIVIANENERFREILNQNISTIDGQIPYLFLKIKYRNLEFEKLSGSDLIFDICKKASELKLKVFLLGGLEISNKLSQKRLKELFPELIISGYSPPFAPYPFPKQHNEKILKNLREFSPDIMFVAFGAPKQEFWIEDNKTLLEKIGIKLAIAVGGTFELVAGIEKRAPKFIQKIGLESVWRLYQNPKRFNRFVRNFKFFKYVFQKEVLK
ncbi:MAG: acetyl-mannosamine transferase [Candidatus Sericytochromatia bacterium]|nr:MAG: acetyl-mannosamine transferase [Candidatus Sericytochromatia bacterium]GIX42977.1 MAG: acetyl-mannosamine transferase [Leptospiraceae bacterium]